MQRGSSRDQNDSNFSHEFRYDNGIAGLKCRVQLVRVDQRRQRVKNKVMKKQTPL